MYGYILSLTILMLVQYVNNVRGQDIVHRENDCLAKDTVLRCQHHVPLNIPRGITEIYILDLLTTNEEFKEVRYILRDSTWQSVQTLDIIVNDNVHIDIYNLTFTHLRKLKTLGLHSNYLKIVHQKAFAGMFLIFPVVHI